MNAEPLDRRETAAWRAAYREGLPASAVECPGDEALAALVAGELTNTERERLGDHVVTCPRCFADYRTVRELHAEAAKAEASRSARRWIVPLAAAAVLVLAGVGFFTLGPQSTGAGSPEDGLRSSGGATAVSPAADAVLASAPNELRWEPQPGASAYRVRLFDAAAELVWEAPTGAAPFLGLPADLTARLRSGSAYFWVVDVEGGGVARPRLGPYWFRLESSE